MADAAFDLCDELGVRIFHPEVFPAALRVILREAPPAVRERVTNFRRWIDEHPGRARPWLVRDYLRRMERAALRAKGRKAE